ncbi:hypothetical protein HF086_017318 [Spodoptera exigua]|uniref:Pre-C2HC domain-containing protein n=1 Tax=Spodoptera exigua TaxID=7107 RepID=A0A922MKP0_SPOEX|nr:hypothetical protein HF086_017318 [Spodoptera exigua]
MFETRPRALSVGDHPNANFAADGIISEPCGRNDNHNWTQVTGKKRPNSSPESNANQKQTKLDTYWLSQSQPIPTTNQFACLESDNLEAEETVVEQKIDKPPPIFVDKVGNIQPLLTILNEHAHDKYNLKVLNNDQVKIQAKDPDKYRNIVHQLELRNTEFFTYKPRQERGFKVVLKNMHPSTNPEEIKAALNEIGHTSTNIWNIKQRTTKKPLPLFIIELKTNHNNKCIYENILTTENQKSTDKQIHSNQHQTYKDVLTNKNEVSNTTIETKHANQPDMHEVMTLMKQMMQQLTTLTNLIIALTNKLSNSIA